MKLQSTIAWIVILSGLVMQAPIVQALDPAPGYVGSQQCMICHPAIKTEWQSTLHSSIYMPPLPENFISNWSGVVTLSDPSKNIPPVDFTLDSNGGQGPFTVTFLGQTYTVDRVHGGRAIERNEDPAAPNAPGRAKYIGKQRYHTKIGEIYMILPLQWNPIPNLDGKDQGWVPYVLGDWVTTTGELAPKLEAQSEERRCAGCHQTGIQVAFNESIQRYELGRIEENIACEACHGPGAEHAATANKNLILNPNNLPTFAQKLDVCGQCHSRLKSVARIGGRELEFGYTDRAFQPGDLLNDFAVDAGGYWPGGISVQHHQQSHDYVLGENGFELSKHAAAGLTCWSCHDPHGSSFEHDLRISARDNGLCLSCHQDRFPDAAAIENHSKHSLAAAGAPRCIDCHMSAVQKSAVEFDIHQHSFSVMTPADTLTFMQPNACVLCHRSYNGVTDMNIKQWNEESDIVINTWLDQQYKALFFGSSVQQWTLYD